MRTAIRHFRFVDGVIRLVDLNMTCSSISIICDSSSRSAFTTFNSNHLMQDVKNPQAEQMVHESMLRTLSLQAEAIWPQEKLLYARYDLPEASEIIDIACGTGEATGRLAARYPGAKIIGVDIEPKLLEVARKLHAGYDGRVRFDLDDAFALNQPDNSFDLSVCRHLLQILPGPEGVVHELVRVTKPGGWVHILSEDYGMIYFHPTRLDNDRFWQQGPIALGRQLNTNMQVGRATYTMLYELGLQDIAVDYVAVDTVRVPRPVFIGIWEAWRDGYTEFIARHTGLGEEEVADHWADMLACLNNPASYAVWQVPVVSGRVPV